MLPPNRAAWLPAQCEPLRISEAPYTTPGSDEVVVRNHAIAINPVNWIKQHGGDAFAAWVRYPFVMGSDVAGEIVEVGSKVTRFTIGQRVLGHAVGMSAKSNRSAEGAFQQYTVMRQHLVAAIPGHVSFEQACVLPLGLSTAACALFKSDYLALDLPNLLSSPFAQMPSDERSRKQAPKAVLIVWGGSTSVGCNAIQLAVAAGYEVVATASPKNHTFLKSLGASYIFDYNSSSAVQDMLALLAVSQADVAGAIAAGFGSAQACVNLLSALSFASERKHLYSERPSSGTEHSSLVGSTGDGKVQDPSHALYPGDILQTVGAHPSRKINRFVAQVTSDRFIAPEPYASAPSAARLEGEQNLQKSGAHHPSTRASADVDTGIDTPPSRRGSPDWLALVGAASLPVATTPLADYAALLGVKTNFVVGSDIVSDAVLAKVIYEDFLPQSLTKGSFVPAPEPLVIGTGLQSVQKALDFGRAGVSARKVVVLL